MNGGNQNDKNVPGGRGVGGTSGLNFTSATPQPQSRLQGSMCQTDDKNNKVRLPQIVPSNRQREYNESMMSTSSAMPRSGTAAKFPLNAPGPVPLGPYNGGMGSSRHNKPVKEGESYLLITADSITRETNKANGS